MTPPTSPMTPDSRADKWAEMSEAIDFLANRVADPNDFPVYPSSSMAGDDNDSHPFEVSQAVRHLINVTVDQLHGAKTLVHNAATHHLAVTATLARAAIENTASGLWILGPINRDLRIERVLRWSSPPRR